MDSPLTSRQIEILILLAKFRFLNRQQIQTLLKHKDFRLIITWLNDLTEKEYTGRIYSRKFGENTKPAIYFLSPKSRKVLKKQKGLEKEKFNWIYREKNRSKKFIEHCLFLTQVYLSFLSSTVKKAKVHLFTKTDLAKYPYLLDPLPDAYIAIEQNGEVIRRYFLEAFDKATPRFVLRGRVQKYLDYSEEGEWEANTDHPFPSILFVCQDETVKSYLYRYIKKILDEAISDISFFLTTKDSIKSQGVRKEIWQRVG